MNTLCAPLRYSSFQRQGREGENRFLKICCGNEWISGRARFSFCRDEGCFFINRVLRTLGQSGMEQSGLEWKQKSMNNILTNIAPHLSLDPSRHSVRSPLWMTYVQTTFIRDLEDGWSSLWNAAFEGCRYPVISRKSEMLF